MVHKIGRQGPGYHATTNPLYEKGVVVAIGG